MIASDDLDWRPVHDRRVPVEPEPAPDDGLGCFRGLRTVVLLGAWIGVLYVLVWLLRG